MTTELSVTQFTLIVGTIFGIFFGLILLIVGLFKKNFKFGLIGFILSLIVGPFLSLLGVLPVFGIFLWLILRKPKPEEPAQAEVISENSMDVSAKDAESSTESQSSGD